MTVITNRLGFTCERCGREHTMHYLGPWSPEYEYRSPEWRLMWTAGNTSGAEAGWIMGEADGPGANGPACLCDDPQCVARFTAPIVICPDCVARAVRPAVLAKLGPVGEHIIYLFVKEATRG